MTYPDPHAPPDRQTQASRAFDEPITASPILRYFAYEHLNPPLSAVSSWFHQLAVDIDRDLPVGAEKSTALRKLLEAKDAAVRSALDLPTPVPAEPELPIE